MFVKWKRGKTQLDNYLPEYGIMYVGNAIKEVKMPRPDVKTPTRVSPVTSPGPDTEERYIPDLDHCPGQRYRTVRRIRRVIEP